MKREEAIKGLKVLAKDFSGYKPNEEMFDMAIKALEGQQWTPVSERIPEPNEVVLISVDGEVDADWFAVDETGYGCWYRAMRNVTDIDAWMPLPDPYREEGEQE